jgi:hypothetical protein
MKRLAIRQIIKAPRARGYFVFILIKTPNSS